MGLFLKLSRTTGKVKVQIAYEKHESTLPWKIINVPNSYVSVTLAYNWHKITSRK